MTILIGQGDVLLFQTDDDGNIRVVNGLTEMSGGLPTLVYMALFGGNEDDDGSANSKFSYWGNIDELDKSRHLRSKTQHALQSLPQTTNNLLLVNDAVKSDLNFLLTDNIATSIDVVVTIPALNRVKIVTAINAVGEESEFEFIENWKVRT